MTIQRQMSQSLYLEIHTTGIVDKNSNLKQRQGHGLRDTCIVYDLLKINKSCLPSLLRNPNLKYMKHKFETSQRFQTSNGPVTNIWQNDSY